MFIKHNQSVVSLCLIAAASRIQSNNDFHTCWQSQLILIYFIEISLKNRHNNHKHEKETKSKEKNHVKALSHFYLKYKSCNEKNKIKVAVKKNKKFIKKN